MKSRDQEVRGIDYFMELPYRIEIQPIPEKEGGGFTASIPKLGRRAVCADGDTMDQALKGLEIVKRERLTRYLEKGVSIPEPGPSDAEYSGKFVARLPKSLHRELALSAKEEGVSLNSLVTTILSRGMVEQRWEVVLGKLESQMVNRVAQVRMLDRFKLDFQMERHSRSEHFSPMHEFHEAV